MKIVGRIIVLLFTGLAIGNPATAYAVQPQQECTICIDGKSEVDFAHPNLYFVLIHWSDDDCEEGNCVDCDEFEWLDGPCGESEGDVFVPDPPSWPNPELMSFTEAEDYLEEHGCVPLCDSNGLPSVASVQNASALTLAGMIQKSNGKLFYSPDRMSIQGIGCGETLLLHVPIDESTAMELAALLDPDRRHAHANSFGFILVTTLACTVFARRKVT